MFNNGAISDLVTVRPTRTIYERILAMVNRETFEPMLQKPDVTHERSEADGEGNQGPWPKYQKCARALCWGLGRS
ncbi:hypothetical protein HYALB_00002599 [Hymenoscyphus albidus]|uniref:Uncharacterized protein n=1 Tax=Hymenoscyphus albidus TaxID=595503 RepID=A0A9N9LUF2_9HELO|nr:hypothetical protein HYALB_00002599 [Hymenoscyphus albidus]